MSTQYRLVGVGNAELVAGLSLLVQQSNALTAQVLAHLVELDERLLHLKLGFSSLFAYCVEGLRMSEGTAGRRVTAARVCRRFPDAFERVARGELHLCALCALAPHLNEQNAAEWFEACKGKTRRQIEELLAARFPRPDVREQIRRLPARGQGLTNGAVAEGMNGFVVQTMPAVRGLEAPVIAADLGSASGPAPSDGARVEVRVADPRLRHRARELEPLSADRFGVHFTADAELRDLIERARALASHQIPRGDLAGLMKLVLASFVKQTEKRRFGIGTKPRRPDFEAKPSTAEGPAAPPGGASAHTEQAAPPSASGHAEQAAPAGRASRHAEQATPRGGASVPPHANEGSTRAGRSRSTGFRSRSRYLRVQVRREVQARDGGQCAYVSPGGRRCNARTLIQFDHLDPFAQGGSSDALNLRLLCQSHNLLHARNCFGNEYIAEKIAARNREDSGPRPR